MTDLDKFLELYQSLGIELKVEEYTYSDDPDYYAKHLIKPGQTIKQIELLEMHADPRIIGYSECFGTRIEFDMNGKFILQGFWE